MSGSILSCTTSPHFREVFKKNRSLLNFPFFLLPQGSLVSPYVPAAAATPASLGFFLRLLCLTSPHRRGVGVSEGGGLQRQLDRKEQGWETFRDVFCWRRSGGTWSGGNLPLGPPTPTESLKNRRRLDAQQVFRLCRLKYGCVAWSIISNYNEKNISLLVFFFSFFFSFGLCCQATATYLNILWDFSFWIHFQPRDLQPNTTNVDNITSAWVCIC